MRRRDLEYTSEGQAVPARLYTPATGAVRGGALLCPGRNRDIDGEEFLAKALVTRGYTVLAIRYRGMHMPSDDADARDGLTCLGQQPGVRSDRMGIVGHSRGGMVALRVAGKDARVSAAAVLAPPTDYNLYTYACKLYSPKRYQSLCEMMGGEPGEKPAVYGDFNPISYADRIKCPVYLVYGTMDLFSPFEHGEWMKAALEAAGNRQVRLDLLPGLGHFWENTFYGHAFDQVGGNVADWLAQALG